MGIKGRSILTLGLGMMMMAGSNLLGQGPNLLSGNYDYKWTGYRGGSGGNRKKLNFTPPSKIKKKKRRQVKKSRSINNRKRK